MVTDKSSPKRRKSIAGVGHIPHSIVPKNRRRAHSIVPGALSPLARARRSLVPRKSILKGSVNNLNPDASSQPTNHSQSSAPDDATESMDITTDLTALIRDNASRKSFGRRVSFASSSHVRLISGNKRRSSIRFQETPQEEQNVSNENDYPGQGSRRRRSSVRQSLPGSEDMDLTTIMPNGLNGGSAILDEEFDYDGDDYDGDDMEVTDIHGGVRRRSSTGGRQALSEIQSPGHSENHEANESRSDAANSFYISESASEMSELSQLMEFTVPLGQSLRPAEQDEAWLALKQMTHSGGADAEPDPSSDDNAEHSGQDMDLEDAMARLRHARDSLAPLQLDEFYEDQQDTFSSTEDSFNDTGDDNRTMNLSQVLGRASLGGEARLSLGQESNMDESEVYGYVVASTPRQSLAPAHVEPEESTTTEHPRPPLVFHPQPPSEAEPEVPANESDRVPEAAKPRKSVSFATVHQGPSTSNSNPRTSIASSLAKPRPSYTAAFAPPTARPSPKKANPSVEPRVTPTKRPPRDSEHTPSSSPAKAQSSVPQPRPLSPSKKSPFQPAGATSSAPSQATISKPSSGLRRPSGYFAKRKSLAPVFTPSTEPALPTQATTTQKNSHALRGRASMGSAPSDAWTRFDREAGSGAMGKVRDEGVEAQEKEAEQPEAAEQATETPSENMETAAQTQPVVSFEQSTGGEPSPSTLSRAPHALQTLVEEPEEEVEPAALEDMEISGDIQVDIDATQQWREGVQEPEEEEEEEPSISIAQFFMMTGVKFMDEINAPRRSMHPSQQALRQPRNPADIPLAEYVTAMAIDIPQMDLYSRVSKDLQSWMEKSKIVLAQAEDEAAKVTPELFVEYARADEEGQAELLHQLKLIRTHTRFLAKSDWYDWKFQWVEGLRATAEEAFVSLENDARALEEPKRIATDLIPALEKEYEEIMRELEQEQAEVAEMEEGDQDYLNELKGTIAEQNIEIEALKAELAEGTEQVRSLEERLEEIEMQKREAKNTITNAERILHLKQTSTRLEVFRLKAELEVLEDLHMCRITKVNSKLFEYVYASLFHVSIPCDGFIPNMTKVNITRYGKQSTRYKDDFPQLSAFLLNAANLLITEGDQVTIVHRLSDFWSSCAQLRSQLLFLAIKYPVEIVIDTPADKRLPGFKAQAMVMFPSKKAKAYISFVFSFDTLSQWPISINSLDCQVDVAYGPIDRSAILKAVSDRLSQATSSDNHACLLDACIEAQEVYH
ncbi:hypothetical protein CPC08DRAFT_625217 [Agrocybe pediades]|nr:hypothetical protein CPC08DRAFT_625217 [Agrocybe pediades]